ncbi:MAG: type II toxin-antitoxin system ParD family antitoxin [Cyanobacteria bacterium J06627_28]
MSISLNAEQEHFVQTKLQNGKYRSAEEILEIAFHLLDEYERSEAEWVSEVQTKVNAAIEAAESTPPVDGETFVNNLINKFEQAKQK